MVLGGNLRIRQQGNWVVARSKSYSVVRLESWEQYLSIISDSPYQNWAFRGQRDASAPLFSALSRYLMTFRVDPRAWPGQEERILRIFKRKAIHFLDHVPERDDDFQWLALMQDHGAPTRLLDFTWSPYVAAFFALHNSTEEGVIWACNPVEIEKENRLDLEKPGSFRKAPFWRWSWHRPTRSGNPVFRDPTKKNSSASKCP